MRIIKTTKDLAEFCNSLKDGEFAAVDTEFMREKTYWPILCLIQVAGIHEEAIIDPLADGIDLAPLLEILGDPKMVKVFHAARQDLEIFYQLMDAVPAPLFDSQIAAMACGFGDQVGYEPLMRSLLNAKIDKGSRFTDWSRRPLTDAQLHYALSDVTHLREAYPILLKSLEEKERVHWVQEEVDALYDPAQYFVEPAEAWRRLKTRNVKQSEIATLMKLAEWREREAQKRDTPRNRIMKDDGIFELSRVRPKDKDDLARARSIPKGFERSGAANGILAAVKAAQEVPKDRLPKIERTDKAKPPPDVVDLLKVLLKRQCEHYGVAPKLIANSTDLEAIALNDAADVKALSGWRREIYGDQAIKLKHGQLALKLKGGAVELVET
ncbi:MAG: ribonuclease D [Marinicaulis sp.]|nr:ribonuclease D [Marinicaulis sp.]